MDRSNSRDYWLRTRIKALLDRLQEHIITKIDDRSALLQIGAVEIAAEMVMLHYLAKNDPEPMVWESFEAAVLAQTEKIKTRPWGVKLTYFVRGPGKRPGITNNAYVSIGHVVSFILEYYLPKMTAEPTYDGLVQYINDFPGADIDSVMGFTAIDLAWDAELKKIADAKDAAFQKRQLRRDTTLAEKLGFPTVEAFYQDQHEQEMAEVQAEQAERIEQEVGATVESLLKGEGAEIVPEPVKDGGYYFWNEPHWYRLDDKVRDRMIPHARVIV